MKARSILTLALLAGCALMSSDGVRAEDPEGPPPGPPREAIEACSGQADGASCSFTMGGRSLAGTCRQGPSGLPAACAPAGGPPHEPPPEAVAACSGIAEGAQCAVTLGGNTLDGVCRSGPHGEARACFPNKMPPPP